MRYMVHWGLDNAERISSSAQLERLLTFLRSVRGRDGAPYSIDLIPAGAGNGGLQLGIGHPDRAFVLALDDAGGFGLQDEMEPWPEPITFDCGPVVLDFKPAWTRIKPSTAIRAAHEYVGTGARPTCLRFDPDA